MRVALRSIQASSACGLTSRSKNALMPPGSSNGTISVSLSASPSYFAHRPKPRTSQDLTHHKCINLRVPTAGGLYAWEFEKAGRESKVRV
jgi:hypothetical protein